MNKLMMFPLTFMFILTIYSVSLAGIYLTGGSSVVESDTAGAEYDIVNGDVTVPGADTSNFDIWGMTGALVVLIAAVAVGIIAGITFFGSGLTVMSQSLIFSSILFLGLWSCLTIAAVTIIFDAFITTLTWFGLTMMYVIGVGAHMSSTSAGG